jgi:tetratricopeptide (TPR) repeat protein
MQARNTRVLIDGAVTRLRSGETTPGLYGLWRILQELDRDARGEDRFWLVNALYHFGVAHDQAGIPAKAMDAFNECVTMFGADEDAAVALLVDQAAINAGLTAFRAGAVDAAAGYLAAAAERLRDATAVERRRARGKALINRAAILRRSGRLDDAERAYDAIHTALGEDDDPVICRDVAVALHEKGKMLETAGVLDRAADGFRAFIRECQSSRDPAIAERVTDAMFRVPWTSGLGDARPLSGSRSGRFLVESGITQLQQGEAEQALARFNEAVEVFGSSARGEDRVWLARAVHNRGMALQALGRNDEAADAFEEVFAVFGAEDDPDVRSVAVSSMINAGVACGGADKVDEALRHLDTAIQLLTYATGMSDRRALANAMYNRGTVLRLAGRTEAALHAFDATRQRFAGDLDPHVYRFVALAIYNSAAALEEADLPNRAAPIFRAAADECGSSLDPLVKERAGLSLARLATCLSRLGRHDDAALAFTELVDRFGADSEPALQQIVGDALRAQPTLLLRLKPADHARTSDYNRQMFLTIVNEHRSSPEGLEQSLASWSKRLDQQASENAEDHAAAAAVLSAFWTRDEPFALFLRNFAMEASDLAIDQGLEFPMRSAIILPGYAENVERPVQAALGGRLPVISISNPSPNITRRGVIPRLELNNHVWLAALDVLVASAPMIVMLLHQLSSGVFDELQTILTHNRERSTVLIVSPSVEAKLPQIAALRAAQLHGGTTPEDPTCPRFALVLGTADLPDEGGPLLPQIDDVLRRLGLTR